MVNAASLTDNHMVVGNRLTGLDRIFHALADRTRRELLARATGDEASVPQHLSMSFATFQEHVAVLERADLVTKQRSGRSQIVRPNTAALTKTIALLDRYEQVWLDPARQIGELLDSPAQGARS